MALFELTQKYKIPGGTEMKKALKVVLALCFMSLIGCAGVTAKKDTPMASYSKMIVRPINFNDTATDKITGDEVAEFKSSWPSLQNKFQSEFEKYIKDTGYFDSVLFNTEAVSDTNTIILETRISSLDPGIRMIMPGEASYLGTLKSSEGKIVARYSAKRKVGRPMFSTMAGTIEKLVTELGEDAATQIGEAKL